MHHARSHIPSLGSAEAEILCVVWQLGEGTVRQVYACLPPNRGITQGTVQTVLRRLRAKGFIEARTDGKTHVFRPVIAEEKVIADAVRQVTRVHFKGNAAAFMEAVAKECLGWPDRLWLRRVLQGRIETAKTSLEVSRRPQFVDSSHAGGGSKDS